MPKMVTKMMTTWVLECLLLYLADDDCLAYMLALEQMDNYRMMIKMRLLHAYLVKCWQKVCAVVDWCLLLAVHAFVLKKKTTKRSERERKPTGTS